MLAAVSLLARYSGSTHTLYSTQLRRWFGWCESNGFVPLVVFNAQLVQFG